MLSEYGSFVNEIELECESQLPCEKKVFLHLNTRCDGQSRGMYFSMHSNKVALIMEFQIHVKTIFGKKLSY